jgi:hypothetical protein
MSTPAESALWFARRGLPVFTLHTAITGPTRIVCSCGRLKCDRPAKHPLPRFAPNGFKDASADERLVAHWWECAPHANVGVATGGIVALDIDPRHDGDVSLKQLEEKHGALPTTWRALTGGGGEHIFFKPPANTEVRNSTAVIGQGIDVRGSGGYVVGAGSRHISGRTYVWNCDYCPDDVALAEMPDWLRRATSASAATINKERVVNALTADVPEGKRDITGAQLAGYLLRRYVDARIALDLMHSWNATRCFPPMSETQVEKIFNSIAGIELRRREAKRGR